MKFYNKTKRKRERWATVVFTEKLSYRDVEIPTYDRIKVLLQRVPSRSKFYFVTDVMLASGWDYVFTLKIWFSDPDAAAMVALRGIEGLKNDTV